MFEKIWRNGVQVQTGRFASLRSNDPSLCHPRMVPHRQRGRRPLPTVVTIVVTSTGSRAGQWHAPWSIVQPRNTSMAAAFLWFLCISDIWCFCSQMFPKLAAAIHPTTHPTSILLHSFSEMNGFQFTDYHQLTIFIGKSYRFHVCSSYVHRFWLFGILLAHGTCGDQPWRCQRLHGTKGMVRLHGRHITWAQPRFTQTHLTPTLPCVYIYIYIVIYI